MVEFKYWMWPQTRPKLGGVGNSMLELLRGACRIGCELALSAEARACDHGAKPGARDAARGQKCYAGLEVDRRRRRVMLRTDDVL